MKIELKEFESLPTKQKFNCLYENQCETLRLIRGYKVYYRLTTIIGSFILLGMGILFKLHLTE
jgi:hypothetical protein